MALLYKHTRKRENSLEMSPKTRNKTFKSDFELSSALLAGTKKNETNVRMVGPHGHDYDQDWDERWEVAPGPEPSRGVRLVQLPHVGPDHSDPARYCVLVTRTGGSCRVPPRH